MRVWLSLMALAFAGCATLRIPDPPRGSQPGSPSAGRGVAVLAGGCFWGVEAVFEGLAGVTDVVSGYTGGSAETAFYEAVGMGDTGHAESVRIEYDPAVVSYGTLLKVFFSIAHDPTRLDSQYPDVGTQYRSAIFTLDEGQRDIAHAYIDTLDASGYFRGPIATEVVPLDVFYPAEGYHQDFVARNPKLPYVVDWDLPMLERLRKTYPELLARR